MDVRELRIGNNISYQGNIVKVINIDLDLEDEGIPLIGVDTYKYEKNKIGGICRKFIYDEAENFEGIQLTEEWLNRLSFEKSNDEFSLEKYDNNNNYVNSLVIEQKGDKFVFTGGEGIPLSVQFNKLHELQNICFSIAGFDIDLQDKIK